MRKRAVKAWRPGKGRYRRQGAPSKLGRLAAEARDLAAEDEAAARAMEEFVVAFAETRGTLDERLARNGDKE